MTNTSQPTATGRRIKDVAVSQGIRETLWVAGAMVLSFAVVVITLRLWRANLRVPIFPVEGDAAFTIATVKGIIEHGWYETNSTLGAPFGQLNYDFPAYVGDFGKIVMIWASGLISSNPAVVMNMILLGSYPLIALTAFLVLRPLGFSRGIALVCAVLFATSPIHFLLAPGQAWLAVYAGVPLSGYLILRALDERPLFTKRKVNGGLGAWLSGRTLVTIAICLLVGCLGLDYAEFTCLLVGLGAFLLFIVRRQARLLGRAIVIIVAITTPVLASAAPSLIYRASHGVNPAVAHRLPIETFQYGLQPIQLVLPQVDDRIGPLAELTGRIDHDLELGAPGTPADLGPQTSLGLVSGAALIWLLWVVIGGALGRPREDPLASQAGVAVLLSILLAVTGGGSVLFAYLVTAQLRVWTRISILIGFFAVVGLGLLLKHARTLLNERTHGSLLTAAVLLTTLVVGVFEGTTNRYIPDYRALTTTWRDDATFVSQVQHSVPHDGMILELPYVPYPEALLPTGLSSYDPLVPYLHSTALRWTGGAMKGRQTDWLAAQSSQPTARLIAGAVAAGFSGVYVLRSGYTDQGASVAASIQA